MWTLSCVPHCHPITSGIEDQLPSKITCLTMYPALASLHLPSTILLPYLLISLRKQDMLKRLSFYFLLLICKCFNYLKLSEVFFQKTDRALQFHHEKLCQGQNKVCDLMRGILKTMRTTWCRYLRKKKSFNKGSVSLRTFILFYFLYEASCYVGVYCEINMCCRKFINEFSHLEGKHKILSLTLLS